MSDEEVEPELDDEDPLLVEPLPPEEAGDEGAAAGEEEGEGAALTTVVVGLGAADAGFAGATVGVAAATLVGFPTVVVGATTTALVEVWTEEVGAALVETLVVLALHRLARLTIAWLALSPAARPRC